MLTYSGDIANVGLVAHVCPQEAMTLAMRHS
jgi:hypothetical protein